MKKLLYMLSMVLAVLAVTMVLACGQAEKEKAPVEKATAKPDVVQEELTASVPALSRLHEVVYPLWHDGYAQKNYDLIKQLLPQADTLTTQLDAAKLPGILRDKQATWDAKKAMLKSALQELHAAAQKNDQEGMLKQVEAFHASYEQLVRTIRPVVPALDAFHQELYKLYHYYTPSYDLEKIRAATVAMEQKLPALKESRLSKRLEARQAEYDAAVKELETEVKKLAETVKVDSKEKIKAAVEQVHTAYQKIEKLFD